MITAFLVRFLPENRRVLFFAVAAVVTLPAVVGFSVMIATAQNANQAAVFTAMLSAAVGGFLTHSCIVLALLSRKDWIFVVADVMIAASMICVIAAVALSPQ